MSLTLAIALVDPYVSAGRTAQFTVAVTNNSSSSVTLTSLTVVEQQLGSARDALISQPNFLTPNVPVGTGNPTILGSSTATYGFKVTAPSPATPGPSPNYAAVAGGSLSGAGVMVGQPASGTIVLVAQATVSDGSTGSVTSTQAVITATPVFPQSLGGSLQFSNPFNAIHLL